MVFSSSHIQTHLQIGNSKTKDQISSELAELTGEEFDSSFTDWLFEQVEQIAGTDDQQDEMMEDSSTPSSSNDSSSRSRIRNGTGLTSVRSAPYTQPSRIVSQINRTLEQSTTPHNPIKRSIPDLPNVPTGPRAQQQSSAGPIRRTRPRTHGQAQTPPVPPNFPAFMLSSGVHPAVIQQMMLQPNNFMSMPSGFQRRPLSDRISDAATEGTPGIVLSQGDRSRCRHWPTCSLGPNCKFHHPFEICP
jgi:hypothetical protein